MSASGPSGPLVFINLILKKVSRRTQGRRRIFKSSPAEEIIECQRHERGRVQEGDSPSLQGG